VEAKRQTSDGKKSFNNLSPESVLGDLGSAVVSLLACHDEALLLSFKSLCRGKKTKMIAHQNRFHSSIRMTFRAHQKRTNRSLSNS
jgi:hypothetical protein